MTNLLPDQLLPGLGEIFTRLDAKDAALMAWGLTATLLNLALIRALAEANRRFNAFVAELASFNARLDGRPSA
jgi:hypothetical protein